MTTEKSLRRSGALFIIAALALGLTSHASFAQTRRRARVTNAAASGTTNVPARNSAARTINVRTEPNAVVWLDEVRRGMTDIMGQLEISKVSAGRHVLRVRAVNFSERSVAILPTQRGRINVPLERTMDEAELTFQQAEEARDNAKEDDARRAAAELYRRAIKLRPRFAAAHVGLARILLDLNDYDGALAEVKEARASRPAYAEASVVEGRILRTDADPSAAIASYQRAIREAHGFQPEAYTGLGIALDDKGRYDEAASAFSKALAQLSDTEPIVYQLLGAVYEKQEKYKEAVAAYEKYLQLAPDGKLAPAIRSIIEQLRQQAAGDIPLPKP